MLNNELKLNTAINNDSIEKKSTRQGLGDALVKLGETASEIVVLTADLTESVKVDGFAKRFPERFIETGIAEQNMAGIAAGLALCGKVPFMASYAEFSPGRNWEQIKISVCYSNANVKICSTHSGLSASFDGATHQALEDIALTRVLPNMTVIVPADYIQAQRVAEKAVKINGPVYIRLSKTDSPVFTTQETPFDFGKIQVLKEGKDISIIACGNQVYEALCAGLELEKEGIDAEIINCPFIKPLDAEGIVNSAKKTGIVLTVEEHQKAGGLGSAVSELLSETLPLPVYKMGVEDSFGESGKYEELLEKHKLSGKHIISKVKSLLKNNKSVETAASLSHENTSN